MDCEYLKFNEFTKYVDECYEAKIITYCSDPFSKYTVKLTGTIWEIIFVCIVNGEFRYFAMSDDNSLRMQNIYENDDTLIKVKNSNTFTPILMETPKKVKFYFDDFCVLEVNEEYISIFYRKELMIIYKNENEYCDYDEILLNYNLKLT